MFWFHDQRGETTFLNKFKNLCPKLQKSSSVVFKEFWKTSMFLTRNMLNRKSENVHWWFWQNSNREQIYNFHINVGERETLRSLLPVLKERIDFQVSHSFLWRIRNMRLKWEKCIDNRRVLVKRLKNRNLRQWTTIENKVSKNTNYMDNYTKPSSWSDSSYRNLIFPFLKANLLVFALFRPVTKWLLIDMPFMLKCGKKKKVLTTKL